MCRFDSVGSVRHNRRCSRVALPVEVTNSVVVADACTVPGIKGYRTRYCTHRVGFDVVAIVPPLSSFSSITTPASVNLPDRARSPRRGQRERAASRDAVFVQPNRIPRRCKP